MDLEVYVEPGWLWIAILAILLFLNVIGPVIIYGILKCNEEKESGSSTGEEDLTYKRELFPGMASQMRAYQAEKTRSRVIKDISLVRILSVLSFLNFWFYIPWSVGCLATTCWEFSRTFLTVAIFGAAAVPLGYVFMLLESALSREKEYIDNIGEASEAAQVISNLRETKPDILWRAECFHYETRTRTVHYTDPSTGQRSTRTETYQERVVTYTDSQYFMYSFWVDVSAPRLEGLDKCGVTRIRLEKKISAGDEETSAEYCSVYEAFKARNRGRDQHMSAWTETTVSGFEKRIAAFVGEPTTPWWMNKRVYWLAVLLAVTWPYRWYFRSKTGKTHYTIEKRFYMTRPQEEGLRQYDGPLTVTEQQDQHAHAVAPAAGAKSTGEEETTDIVIEVGGTVVKYEL